MNRDIRMPAIIYSTSYICIKTQKKKSYYFLKDLTTGYLLKICAARALNPNHAMNVKKKGFSRHFHSNYIKNNFSKVLLTNYGLLLNNNVSGSNWICYSFYLYSVETKSTASAWLNSEQWAWAWSCQWQTQFRRHHFHTFESLGIFKSIWDFKFQ